MILVLIKNIPGDSQIEGFKGDDKGAGGYFSVDSFSFGTERELKDSGKAGTSDINIGVAELQEVSMGKSMDISSAWLARKAIAGSSCGTAEIKFVQTIEGADNTRKNVVYMAFKLDNAFIKTWSISGDEDDRPTEEFTMWYNKIAFNYFATTDGMNFTCTGICSWDAVAQKPWDGSALATKIEEHPAKG